VLAIVNDATKRVPGVCDVRPHVGSTFGDVPVLLSIRLEQKASIQQRLFVTRLLGPTTMFLGRW
jgi:hypothetical protein